MIDLYAALELPGPSSHAMIERALQRMPTSWPLRETVSFVLLNARRRSAYDRAWIAESMIASIRNELRLDSTALWTTSSRMTVAPHEADRRARANSVRGE